MATGGTTPGGVILPGSVGATQLADPGTGKVWGSNGAGSAAAVNPPGYTFGYDQITAPVTVTSVTEATGTAVISAAAHTFDGSPVVAHFFAPGVSTDNFAGHDAITVCLFEGATEIGRLATVQILGTGTNTINVIAPANGFVRFTPTAAAHTYTVTAFCDQQSGVAKVLAGAGGTAAYAAAFIRFYKV